MINRFCHGILPMISMLIRLILTVFGKLGYRIWNWPFWHESYRSENSHINWINRTKINCVLILMGCLVTASILNIFILTGLCQKVHSVLYRKQVVKVFKKMKALNASFDDIRVLVKQNLSEEFEIDDWQFYSQQRIRKFLFWVKILYGIEWTKKLRSRDKDFSWRKTRPKMAQFHHLYDWAWFSRNCI